MSINKIEQKAQIRMEFITNDMSVIIYPKLSFC